MGKESSVPGTVPGLCGESKTAHDGRRQTDVYLVLRVNWRSIAALDMVLAVQWVDDRCSASGTSY